MIIGISGKKQHGKDTVAKIIQWLTEPEEQKLWEYDLKTFLTADYQGRYWKRKAFATKLKQIVAIIIGCDVKQLENGAFKEQPLSEEWKITVVRDFNFENELEVYTYTSEEEAREKHPHRDRFSTYILTPRKILQLMGSECGRNISPDIWVNSLMSEYKGVVGTVKKEARARRLGDGTYTTGDNPLVPKEYHHKIIKDPLFCWFEKIDEPQYPNWIVTDVRFLNEVKAVKDRGGILIRVNRPGSIRCNRCYWVGNQDDLAPFIDGDEQHDGCPKCKTDSYLMDLVPDNHPSETALDDYQGFDHVIENIDTLEALVARVSEILLKEGVAVSMLVPSS